MTFRFHSDAKPPLVLWPHLASYIVLNIWDRFSYLATYTCEIPTSQRKKTMARLASPLRSRLTLLEEYGRTRVCQGVPLLEHLQHFLSRPPFLEGADRKYEEAIILWLSSRSKIRWRFYNVPPTNSSGHVCLCWITNFTILFYVRVLKYNNVSLIGVLVPKIIIKTTFWFFLYHTDEALFCQSSRLFRKMD